MIYLKNNTEKQTIFIPRNELQKEAFITTIRTYEDGLKEGYGNGIEDQKDQLLNLYVTENGTYEREDGYGKVTVVVSEGGTDCKEAIETAYEDGYKEGYEDGAASIQIDLENKSIDIVSNGEYTVTPTDGFDALESVKISVDVPNEGNCNLEDKIIAPQINEVDGDGYIYVYPNEGYDGMKEVALQTDHLKNGWYNEGYEQGKSEGGGDGEYNVLDFTLSTDNYYEAQKFAANEGVSGWQEVVVRTEEAFDEMRERGRNEIRNSLTTLNVTENGIYDTYEVVTYEVNVLDAQRADYIFVGGGEEKNYLRILFSTFSNKEVQLEKETLGRFGEYYLTYNDGGIRIEGLDLGNLPYDVDPNHINEVIITPTTFEVNGNRQDLPINLFELMGYNTWLEVGPFDNTIISVSKDDSIYLHLNRYNTGDTIDRRYMDFKTYTEEAGWNRVEVNVSVDLQDKRVTPSMADRDDNGLIAIVEDEGYDGLIRVVIDPNTIYKEGYDSGRDLTDYIYNQITLYSYRNISFDDFEECFYDSNNEPITDVLVVVEEVDFEYSFNFFTKVPIKTCLKIPYPNNALYGLTRLYFKNIPSVRLNYKDNNVVSLYVENVDYLNMNETTLNGLLRIWLKGSTTFSEGLEIGTAQIKNSGTIYSDGTNTDKISSSFSTWTIINDHKLP